MAQSYGNSRQAVEAVGSGVCLVDRSHWPRIRLTGRDRIPVLQRFTTQDFSNLTPGQGCDTVRQGVTSVRLWGSEACRHGCQLVPGRCIGDRADSLPVKLRHFSTQ